MVVAAFAMLVVMVMVVTALAVVVIVGMMMAALAMPVIMVMTVLAMAVVFVMAFFFCDGHAVLHSSGQRFQFGNKQLLKLVVHSENL